MRYLWHIIVRSTSARVNSLPGGLNTGFLEHASAEARPFLDDWNTATDASVAAVAQAYQKRIADMLSAVVKKYDLGRRRMEMQPVPNIEPQQEGPVQQSLWPEQAKVSQPIPTEMARRRFTA